MTEVAKTLPNGEWNSETGQLLADIPNQDQLNNLKTTVNAYVDGEIKTLNDNLVDKINTDITATKEELSASVTSVQEQVDGLEIGARNLLVSYADQYNGMVKPYIESTQSFDFTGWDVDLYSNEYINQKLKAKTQYTISYDVEVIGLTDVDQQLEPTELSTGLILFDKTTNDYVMRSRKQMPREIGYTEHIEETFEMKSGNFDLLAYSNLFNGNVMQDNETQNETNNDTEPTQPITDEQNTTTDTNTTESTTNDTTTTQEPTQEPTQDTTIDNTTTDGTTQEPVKTIEVSESDTIRITNLKLEKGTVATDWTPAPEDFQNELNSVSTSVEEQNTELSLMKDSINLKADKSTVTQQLGEVESKVQDNKAQLGIQADEINSKVSESKYTADQENVVSRLDNAETERQQLSTEINDRVTLSEYQNLNIGTRNLMLDTKERDDFTGLDDTFRYIEYQLTRPLTVGNEYTLSYEIYDLSGEPINQVSYLPYEPAGERKDVSVTDNKVVSTFKAKEKSEKMYLYKGIAGLTDPTKDFVIKNAMLVEGNKVGDYDKAPEQADTRLTEMETSISQNGEQIQDRVSLTEFNESNKTLSQVVSTLTQDTTNGLTYTFDENGKITNFNVGKDGVTIKGDSVDITVNDDFKVIAQDVDNKVDQDNIINRLNLSPEGLDIDVNNLGIRGGDSNQYLNIENDTIELHGSYTRTWQGSTDYNEVFTRLKDGHLRFRNNDLSRSIYLSDFGVSTYLDGDPRNASGTLEFFDYTYDSGARGVTLQSGLGVVALRADANRMVIEADDTVNIGSNKYSVYLRPFANTRVGVNEFQYYVKDNPTADATDGVLLYGNLTGSGTKMGSGIRFSKSAPVVYATNDNGDMGSGYFFGEGFQGDWLTKNTNLYACVQSNGSLRVTDIMGYNGGDPNYRDIEAMRLNTYHSYAFANHSGSDVYFGVGYNELRITANNWWNGGDTQYQNVRARTFYGSLEPNSSEKYKTNIENWNIDATQTLRDTKLYEYNYISDLERGEDIKKHGVILERETPDHIKGTDTIDLYEMVSTNTKALKEQIERNDELERKIKSLEAIVIG
ncbi:hypothetical protein ABLV89_01300 [Staphylococcus equorum]